jgi:hypothetical protein
LEVSYVNLYCLAEMPIDANLNIREVSKRRLFAKTKTFGIFWQMFYSLFYRLDMDYWVLHTGTDGYLYLLFQRRFFKLTIYLTCLSMIVSFALNIYASPDEPGLSSFFYRTTLENKQFENQLISYFQVFMVFVYTFLTINAV